MRLLLSALGLLSLAFTDRQVEAVTNNVNNVAVQCGASSTGLLVCGPRTPLQVAIAMTLPVAEPDLSTLTFPISLVARNAVCLLQDTAPLTVGSAELTSYDAESHLWRAEINCSLPETSEALDAVNDDEEDEFSFQCDFSARIGSTAAVSIPVDVTFEPFTYLSSEWAIANMSLTQASRAVGIDQIAEMSLEVTGASADERQQTLEGFCVVNDQNCSVSSGILDYTVQVNDSDFTSGLEYLCQVHDGAGNSLKQNGVVLHSNQQIDGSLPELAGVFMLFSSDKPARIGSVISITLRAVGLKSGYSGSCTVNGIPNWPLLQAEDDGFYMTQYIVASGDLGITHVENGSSVMELDCIVRSSVGNEGRFQRNISLDFGIDAKAPEVVSTSILFTSDNPAHEGSIIEVQVVLADAEPNLHIAGNKNSSCLVNNVSVTSSFSMAADNSFLVTYVVGDHETPWKSGELPIRCVVSDAAGNNATVDQFTDGNTLFSRELKPVELEPELIISLEYLPDVLLLTGFAILAVASHTISKLCPYIGLPRITGYLVTGILAGPYVLNFITKQQLRQLRIIDEVSMAYIGLTAGSKLHWKTMRPILKSILVVTLWLVVAEYIVGTLTVAVLAGFIDFLHDTTNAEKYAIAVLAGCMMIARSPSSALAVIEETKAQGHFTTLIFAVTVMCDVLVILLFNVNSMITESFLSEQQLSSEQFLRLVLQLCGSIGAGLVFGKLLGVVILYRHHSIKRKSMLLQLQQAFKQTLILVYGWGVFVVSHLVHPYIEPLLCCMVSGAVMWNASANPEELGVLLRRLADLVYVCFFTITGATLELDMLAKALALSAIMCLTRVGAIFLGSCAGGMCAGEDPTHSRVAWMAYITQAGVTLGLAKQIQLLYPGWGSYFATMIVAVVICNQLLGPPLLRYVLRFVGDAKKREVGKVDGLSALVFSSENNAHSAAGPVARLEMCGWHAHSQLIEVEETPEVTLAKGDSGSKLRRQVLDAVQLVKPDVAVVLMPTDEDNFDVIRALSDVCHELRRLRVLRVVVQVAGTKTDAGSPSSLERGGAKWSTVFAEMPVTEVHGDTIDVVVVDRREATDMLIELAACGKVVNTAVILAGETGISSSTAIETIEEDNVELSTRTRLRRSLTHKVRRLMLV